jgi:hypothetical protein
MMPKGRGTSARWFATRYGYRIAYRAYLQMQQFPIATADAEATVRF